LRQSRQQQCGQNGDDGYDDKKFDDREGVTGTLRFHRACKAAGPSTVSR